MFKFIALIIYKLIFIIDLLANKFFRRNILLWVKEFIEEDHHLKIKIGKKNFKFFVPNNLIKWRIDTFFEKEPETIEWIDGFKLNKFTFWDIGANIGQYAIYCAAKHKNSIIIAFEPSANNLRVLCRNIAINKFYKKIKLLPIALTNIENDFQILEENDVAEGSAHNNFGKTKTKRDNNLKYTTYGTSINYLIKNKILRIPNYIKIDVDGIELLILLGAGNFLLNKDIKEISIEINKNKRTQYKKILKIMKKNNFEVSQFKHNKKFHLLKNSKNTYNFLFKRI